MSDHEVKRGNWRCPACQTELPPGARECIRCDAVVLYDHWQVYTGRAGFIRDGRMALLFTYPLWIAACWSTYACVLFLPSVAALILFGIRANAERLFRAGCLLLITWLPYPLLWYLERLHVNQEVLGMIGAGVFFVTGLYSLSYLVNAYHHPLTSIPPWCCQLCGYPLYALTEPRCPECGKSFDPTTIPAEPPVVS